MDEKQLQQEFLMWLAHKVGALSEDGQVDENKLKEAIGQLGEQGMKQAQEQFMEELHQHQVRTAKLGAKLEYIDHLRRGSCTKRIRFE